MLRRPDDDTAFSYSVQGGEEMKKALCIAVAMVVLLVSADIQTRCKVKNILREHKECSG